MTRVSENSSQGILRHNLNKNRQKMEKLQLQGSTLKTNSRISDNSINGLEALTIKSKQADNEQYARNAGQALLYLNASENSLQRLTDIMMRAKEIVIGQASNFYNPSVKKNVASEVEQMRYQVIGIGNKSIRNRYLFGGFKSLERPFDDRGVYQGDGGRLRVEIDKNIFLPVNFNGYEIFHLYDGPELSGKLPEANDGLVRQLDDFISALKENRHVGIQSLIDRMDRSINHLITLRTRAGSLVKSAESSINSLELDNIDSKIRHSKLEDVDVTELFSNISKQQNLLKTTYKAGQAVISQSLLDFIK